MPKGIRLKPEQIVAKLREIEVKIGQGKDVLTACREAGATDKSYYRWRREYGGMKVDQAKRLKQLEQENARLNGFAGCVWIFRSAPVVITAVEVYGYFQRQTTI